MKNRIMNRNALLATACSAAAALTTAASAGTYKTITIDGDFSDWTGVPVLASDPAGDGSPIDYANVQIANDANNLYLRVTYQSPVNPNAAGSGNSNLAFDTDNNTATGFDIYSLGLIGSEVGFQNDFPFSEGTGNFNTGRGITSNGAPTGAAIAPFDYGNPADPFLSQEYSIPRNIAYGDNGQAVFGNSFHLLLWTEGGTANDETISIPYTFGALTSGWTLGGSGDYNVASNWSTNAVPNGIDAVAEFGTSITQAETVYSNTAVTTGTVIFNNANTYVFAGAGSLTMDVSTGSGAINVLQGSHKINLPLRLNDNTLATIATGATLTIADPLTLANGSTLTHAGGGTLEIISTTTTVSGSAIIATSAGTTNLRMPLGGSVALSSAGGSTVSFATQRVTGVSITGGTVALDSVGSVKVLDTDSLTIAGGASPAGKLDIGDNGVIVRGGSSATIRSLIIAGRASGGNGITTSATTTGGAVGYANSSQVPNLSSNFLGEAYTGAAVLVRFTLAGDTNLDGIVNFNDLVSLAQNYGLSGKEWVQGDFNYDGIVNFNDLVPLAQNYNGSINTAALVGLGGEGFASDWKLASALAPEPTTLSLIGLGAVIVRRRRNG